MIIVTGAAGFIPSVFIGKLLSEGYRDIIAVDDFSREDKKPNWENWDLERVERDVFFDWVKGKEDRIESIVHLGARTDTTEFDKEIFDRLNEQYSRDMWALCTEYQIPLIYASSAATYGLGEHGYVDSHAVAKKLQPLNPYGWSKQNFDLWALERKEAPFFWAGIKFFNVYGPNEYHKGRMASVVFHTFNQVSKTGAMKLFRSHREDVEDGYQSRDFIYVKDVVDVLYWLMENRPESGLYNLGTGKARPFIDLAKATFEAMGKTPDIRFIDTPEDIRDTYQYFTEAAMQKLRKAGYKKPFTELEDGVKDYVRNYLLEGKRF